MKDEEIELQTQLSTSCTTSYITGRKCKGQEQLKSWVSQFSEKQREEERINGTVTLLEEQLRTTKREVEDTSLRISEAESI